MGKRINKQNRNKQVKPPVNSGMSERKKKIYAYILAGFIIFWNVASVLGIVAFVRSFAKNDSSSEERTYAVTQVANDNDVQRLSNVITASADNVYYQQFDLGLQGATLPPSHEFDNFICFADGNAFVRFTTDGKLYLSMGSIKEITESTLGTSISVPVNAFRITGGNPYLDRHTLTARAFYSNPNDYRFANDIYCYVRYTTCKAYLDKATVSDFSRTLRLEYTFQWYDSSVYLGDSTLTLNFGGHYVYHERWDFLYPYRGISKLISGADPVIEVNIGRINNTYRDDFINGYYRGVVEANKYDFDNLFSSVIDVPIKAFTDMFNFELLGVNLADFFFAILSVCAIIAVIRLFL